MCKTHILEANPASDLDLPKLDNVLPVEALTVSQVEAIMSAPDITDPLGIRDRAILEMFYSTAIRRAEMVDLKVSDLNREKHILWIRLGKGRKDRVVPVGQRALAWVEKYIEDVRPLLAVNPSEQTLFLTGYGQAFNRNVLGRHVHDYIVKAGIVRETAGPHLLRHTCATHMHEHGADIRFIQQLLGVMVQFVFHLIGIDGIILYDILQFVIVKCGIHGWHFMYIGQLCQVIAIEDGAVPDAFRQGIKSNTQLHIGFGYFK